MLREGITLPKSTNLTQRKSRLLQAGGGLRSTSWKRQHVSRTNRKSRGSGSDQVWAMSRESPDGRTIGESMSIITLRSVASRAPSPFFQRG